MEKAKRTIIFPLDLEFLEFLYFSFTGKKEIFTEMDFFL